MRKTQAIIGREKKKTPIKDKVKPQKEVPLSLEDIASIIFDELHKYQLDGKSAVREAAYEIRYAWRVVPLCMKNLARILRNIPRENLHGTRLGSLREQFLDKFHQYEVLRTTIRD